MSSVILRNTTVSNVSLFDRPNLEKLFGDVYYPDGSQIDMEYVIGVQKIIGEFFSKGDPKTGLPYRFPVISANLSVDENREPLDGDFFDFIARTNVAKGVYNIYASEGNKIAMCPLGADEEVVIRNHKGVFKSKIGNLGRKGKTEYEVLYRGKFLKGSFLEVPYQDFIEITLSNGQTVLTTDNHLNITSRGTLMSSELVVGDSLPFNLVPTQGEGGNYDLGYVVGAYLGDGCASNGSVVFSLNNTTKKAVFEKVKQICESALGASMTVSDRGNVLLLATRSLVVRGLVNQFTAGEDTRALTKGINSSVLSKSLEFRQGILDGYMATDGGNKGRIYTASTDMVKDLTALVASLGGVVKVSQDERDGRLGDNPVYTVKVYDTEGLRSRSYSGVWHNDPSDVNTAWFYITQLKRTKKPYNTKAYCFEMHTDEHLFQLANGLITHNCRYINSLERMEYRADSFGNGGLNIGSHRIVTINFARLALDSGGDEAVFFKLLNSRLLMCRDLLVVHREEILERRIEGGFLKFFKPLGWMSLNRFFSTIGINALYEMCHFMGKPMQTPEGTALTTQVLTRLEEAADEFSRVHGYSFNTEEIPAESAAVSFAAKDALVYPQPFKLYSNQYVPLIADVDPIERIELSGLFMSMVSGGGILHINLQDGVPDAEIMRKIMLLVLQSGVPHFAINYGFGQCENGHTVIVGNSTQCPLCQGKITDYLTRIIGYFTKVNSWNEVRRTYEYPKRKFGKAI